MFSIIFSTITVLSNDKQVVCNCATGHTLLVKDSPSKYCFYYVGNQNFTFKISTTLLYMYIEQQQKYFEVPEPKVLKNLHATVVFHKISSKSLLWNLLWYPFWCCSRCMFWWHANLATILNILDVIFRPYYSIFSPYTFIFMKSNLYNPYWGRIIWSNWIVILEDLFMFENK